MKTGIFLFLAAFFLLSSASFSDPPPPQPRPDLGKGIEGLGNEVAKRIERVVKKNAFTLWDDPWTVQGIPLVFPSPSTGFNLGVHVLLQNVRRVDPHKFQLSAQVLASDLGRYKHFLALDFPYAFDGKFRVTTRLAYDRDIAIPFFGIGNNVLIDLSKYNNQSDEYKDIRGGPSLEIQVQRYFGRYFRIGPTLGFKWTDVLLTPGSTLALQQPNGVGGGKTHTVGLGMVYDTTDFEPYPSRGEAHEIFFRLCHRDLGGDYNFFRFTYTFRRYWPLHRQLILASRLLVETLVGDPPYYELGAVGGVSPQLVFGGSRFLRGYPPNRFVDKTKMALGVELRWDPLSFSVGGQELVVSLVPFLDIGRVWPSGFPTELWTMHASTGWGLRLIWNDRFVMRGDFAINTEGTNFYAELGNAF